MSETSGFFDAQWDDAQGDYDRKYYASQFADYFKLLIGNGVFASPTDQLKISNYEGLKVKVLPGWGFINGFWYHNDEQKVIDIPENNSATQRVDSVKLRWSIVSREILVGLYQEDTSVIRNDSFFEIKLAEITVPPFATAISASNIKDVRSDSSVCGFVKGLVDVIDTKDLFSQYDAMFNSWFESVQAMATSAEFLQMREYIIGVSSGEIPVPVANKLFKGAKINGVNFDGSENITIEDDTKLGKNENAVSATKLKDAVKINGVDFDGSKSITVEDSTKLGKNENAVSATKLKDPVKINGVNFDGSKEITIEDNTKVSNDKDFVLRSMESLVFSNKVCTIMDSRIKISSLADVYFTTATLEAAAKASISVETTNGALIISAERDPEITLVASIRIRVV